MRGVVHHLSFSVTERAKRIVLLEFYCKELHHDIHTTSSVILQAKHLTSFYTTLASGKGFCEIQDYITTASSRAISRGIFVSALRLHQAMI